MLGININFWYGIFAIGGLTVALTLLAWLIPPKKNRSDEGKGDDGADYKL